PLPSAHSSPLSLHDALPILPVGGRLDRATACPAFVVYLGWNTVGWRRGSKDVGNEAFIIAPYGVVSDPARRRAPVPIQHMLTVLDRKSTRLNSSHVKNSYAV